MNDCSSNRRRTQRGYVLLFAALMTIMILVPAIGLAVDVGMMYMSQALLSAAADASVLAGARALSRGSDDAAQHANAEAAANTCFYSNFPAGFLGTINLTVTSTAATDATSLRSVTTGATVDLPLIFMRFFGSNTTRIAASAVATRRDVNIMIIMDRSTSLTGSGACAPLKAAAVGFVEKFSEGRDNLGLITFGTSSKVERSLSSTFKTSVESTLNGVVCDGATNSSQALWQGYQELVRLNQNGALNAIVFFTDGRPTAVTEDFPILASSGCSSLALKRGVLTSSYTGNVPQSPWGLFTDVPPIPLGSDLTPIASKGGCHFASTQTNVAKDVANAPILDHWGNSLTATAYKTTTTSGAGLDVTHAQNIENFSVNAADHAALRIRRGDPDPTQANHAISGVVVYTIGLGTVDGVLLERIANDPALTPNPVAAGRQGRYSYAADPTALDLAFTRVASEMLRIAK
jgi:Flp pilus assembly protein TadG